MALKSTARTPSRVLTLAEMEMTFSRTKQKNPANPMPPHPISQPKRLVDMFADMLPPDRRQITSVKKPLRPANQLQKTYLSTSKKQIQSRKTDHTIVRRALNFVATKQIEETQTLQIHPKSKQLPRHTMVPGRFQTDTTNNKGVSKSVTLLNKENNISKQAVQKPTLTEPTKNHNRSTIANTEQHTYGLRSRSIVSEFHEPTTSNTLMFTQYRNVNESFDLSIHEEFSPQINATEKSIMENNVISETNSIDSQLSDLLSDVLCTTELSSNKSSNIKQKITDIYHKAKENDDKYKSQIKTLTFILDEVTKNKKELMSCVKNNEDILIMTKDLLKSLDDGTIKSIKKNKRTSIPVSLNSTAKLVFDKFSEDKFAKPSTKYKVSPIQTIEGSENTPNSSKGNKGRSNIKLGSSKKENMSPLRKKFNLPKSRDIGEKYNTKKESPRQIFSSPKFKKLPQSNLESAKRQDLRKTVLKSFVVNSNNIATGSPKNSKSQQMFKTLKDSVNFLKTPVGKGKKNIVSNVAFETPNTRSRNITSSNIKRQLESLYD